MPDVAVESSSDRASAILRAGYARTPSWFDPGRYQRLPPDSSGLAWLFGLAGLLVPPMSIAGVVSGWRVTRRGNRLGAVAAVFCVLTATVGVAAWVSLFTGASSSSTAPFSVTVSDVHTGVTPPDTLGFASTGAPGSYAEVDLTVTNDTDDDVAMAPSAIDVQDAAGRRLAWATTDEGFLAINQLAADESVTVDLYVALPPGSSVAHVALGGAGTDV